MVNGVVLMWIPDDNAACRKWNEISDKLSKQGAMKNMSAIPCSKLLLSVSHEIYSILEKAMYKSVDRNKPAIFLAPDI